MMPFFSKPYFFHVILLGVTQLQEDDSKTLALVCPSLEK